MSHPQNSSPDSLALQSLSHQLCDSLEANKPDSRELDLGSPVSPLRPRGALTSTVTTATTTSSSSSSSGSAAALNNAHSASKSNNHSGELTSPAAVTPNSRNTKLGHARSDPLIYSGGNSHAQSSVNSPPTANVLPAGNICPSGKILKKPGATVTTPPKTDVLGSRTGNRIGNYGHGSIMRGRGGGSVKSAYVEAEEEMKSEADVEVEAAGAVRLVGVGDADVVY